MKTVYIGNNNGFAAYELIETTGILGIYEPEKETICNNDFDDFNDFNDFDIWKRYKMKLFNIRIESRMMCLIEKC